jgi:hypothetical protein
VSAIAEEIPRQSNWTGLIAAGAITLLMAIIFSQPFGVEIDSSSSGDGNLANGDDRCDELGSACIGTISFQATGYTYTGDLGGLFAETPRVNTSKFIRTGYGDPYLSSATFYNNGGTSGSGFSIQSNCYSSAPSPVRCVRVTQGVGVHNT